MLFSQSAYLTKQDTTVMENDPLSGIKLPSSTPREYPQTKLVLKTCISMNNSYIYTYHAMMHILASVLNYDGYVLLNVFVRENIHNRMLTKIRNPSIILLDYK